MFTRSMTKSVLITQERETISVTIKTMLPQVWFLPLFFLTLLCLLFISWALLYCLQGQGMTNEDAINRKQSSSLVLSLHFQEETRPFQWVTQTRTQAHTSSLRSIMYRPLFTYLTPPPPHTHTHTHTHTCQHSKFPTPATLRSLTQQWMIMKPTYCQPWLRSIRTQKSGYFWMCKRKLSPYNSVPT